MSQYRLNLFIQPEHAKRLEELAAKKGVSKSSIVAAALASWLSPDAGDQREAAIAKRLDRLVAAGRAYGARPEHQIETLALFIPLLPDRQHPDSEAHQDAARAQAKRVSSNSWSGSAATCCVAAAWCATLWKNCRPGANG